MLVEILHTVRISIFSKEFMLVKPFLIIGLIVSVQARPGDNDGGREPDERPYINIGFDKSFRSAMTELGLLGFMVFVFAFSMYLLSRVSHRDDTLRESGTELT
jgi:hypothetical protein